MRRAQLNLHMIPLMVGIIIIYFGTQCFAGEISKSKKQRMERKIGQRISQSGRLFPSWKHVGSIKMDSVRFKPDGRSYTLYFSTPFSYLPIREDSILKVKDRIQKTVGRRYANYPFDILTDHHRLEELVPNTFRKVQKVDQERVIKTNGNRVPVVIRNDAYVPTKGLYGNGIALWDSHGFYYESKLDRWEWQRAPLFGTVEDISTMSFVLPYLVPMLENSGASVYLPRERDWQHDEVIVDNDGSSKNSRMVIDGNPEISLINHGFKMIDTLFAGQNPFQMGTAASIRIQNTEQRVNFIPDFTTGGSYAVYVAYPFNNSGERVSYTVHHLGGKTSFMVDQSKGFGTWIYLGTFQFAKGSDPVHGKVVASLAEGKRGQLMVDAVRFGGGMGNVARKPGSVLEPNKKSSTDNGNQKPDDQKLNTEVIYRNKLSNLPRYLEAARYYLQYAGFPDSTVYNLNKNKNDYNDDYQSRGEWVNYLMGGNDYRTGFSALPGLRLPIDLAFAFHTDAGITPNDSIIGTLAIYSTVANNGKFIDDHSRMGSRDLSDLIQTQIVGDIRQLGRSDWTRRGLWDKQYSEAWRPQVPTMLLELLSHQNLSDMQSGLDPRFRFLVSRAIYKGMLRFQTSQENRSYVVQPLPIHQFAIQSIGKHDIRLSWHSTPDPLEPSAKASGFKVYRRLAEGGFDNGVIVLDSSLTVKNLPADTLISFKVTAINDGGESFPSEILSAGFATQSRGNALVVNGFNRICAPSTFLNEKDGGVAWWDDLGVPDREDISTVGFQYDFKRKSGWLDDDSPGWGASHGDLVGKVLAGNRFDYPAIHGTSLLKAGYSFVSMSSAAFEEPSVDLSAYTVLDLILGKQRSTKSLKSNAPNDFPIYTTAMIGKLTNWSMLKKPILISGAYVGSELNDTKDSTAIKFAKKILHFSWRTGHASKAGDFEATDGAQKWLTGNGAFNTTLCEDVYPVESPDALEPEGKGAITAIRYKENQRSGAVLFDGDSKGMIMGFPFETILGEQNRDHLMKQILHFFETK